MPIVNRKKFGLTNKGLVVPRYADFLEQMIGEYEAETGVTVVREPGDALYSIFVVAARQYDAQAQILVDVYDAQDPNNATGVQLDTMCQIAGITRHAASHSTVQLTLTGTPGVTVPDGKQVEGDNRKRWMLTDPATFNASGTATTAAIALETGRIEAAPGTVTAIVTPVAGWTGVTNPTAATPGREVETVRELRRRREQSLQIRGRANLAAIRARLLALPFIRAAVVLENDLPYEVVIPGIGPVPGGSVVPVVYSASDDGRLADADQIKQVARVLYDAIAGGVKCYGIDQSTTVVADDGATKTIAWSYAQPVSVGVAVQVDGVDPALIEGEVNALVREHFSTLAVGDPVRRLPILVAVGGLPGVTEASVRLNGNDADVLMSEIQVGIVDAVTVR